MNSTSESTLIELRISRAYAKLSCIPEDAPKPRFPSPALGCEIRMLRAREPDLDGTALFWLELLDSGNTCIDSFRCHKLKGATPVFEYFSSRHLIG